MSEPATPASGASVRAPAPSASWKGRVLLGLGRALAALAWLLRIRRRVVLDNLARAFPEKSARERTQLGRAVFRSLGESLGEMALARSLPDPRLAEWVEFDGFERFTEASARGRGVVVAIAHFGNWELLGWACARRGVRLSLIGRNLRGFWNRKLVVSRERSGMGQLPDRGSSKEALRRLRQGEVLALAIDQNMRPRRGIFVDFFGYPACTTPAAAVYALRAGAPILAAFPVRDVDGRHRVLVQGPFAAPPGVHGHAAVVALTQQLTAAVEQIVRAHPEQWFWLHRRWKTRAEPASR